MFRILKRFYRSDIIKITCASLVLGVGVSIAPLNVKNAEATSIAFPPHGVHHKRHFKKHRFHHRRHFKRHRHHRHYRHYYRGHRGFHFGFHGPRYYGPRYYGPSYYGRSYYGGGYPVPVAQPVPVPQPVYCPVPVAVPVAVPTYTSSVAVGPVYNVFGGGGCY